MIDFDIITTTEEEINNSLVKNFVVSYIGPSFLLARSSLAVKCYSSQELECNELYFML